MSLNDRFPPVGLSSETDPWGMPALRPGPHRLPPGSQLPRKPGDTLIRTYDPDSQPDTRGNTLEAPQQPRPVEAPSSMVRDPHRYANLISLNARPGTQQDLKFLDAPSGKRNFLSMRNISVATILYIDFGKFADVNSVFSLLPGILLVFDEVVPQGDVHVFADGANGILAYSYSNISELPNG